MDAKTATLATATAALAAGPALAGQSLASPEAPAIPVAASYAELLEPMPNAMERLQLSDAQAAERPAALIPVQWAAHHHHHHHTRRWYLSHGYMWSGGAWIVRPRAHHHYHHNHDHN